MNYSVAVFLINTELRAVKGTYDTAQEATTFKTFDDSIKKDDICVVASGTRHGMTTVKITEVDVDVDFDSPHQMGWIVAKVDQEPYKKTLDQEAKAIAIVKSGELRKKREDLAEAILKDQRESLKTLEIATFNKDGAESV